MACRSVARFRVQFWAKVTSPPRCTLPHAPLFSPSRIPITLGLLGVLFVLLLFLIPPEARLGGVIRLVYLHAALVQVGLVAFGAAGIAGLWALADRRSGATAWSDSLQRTAVILWVLYALSSAWVTHEAWGQWVAWDEPRTRASVRILVLALAFFAISLWVRKRWFTAVANVVLGTITWILVKTAHLLRHPENPIGTSDHDSYRLLFGLLLAVAFLMGFQFARWMRHREGTGAHSPPPAQRAHRA